MANILSIVVPNYNEEKTIATVIDKLLTLVIPDYPLEIIIVDDCSTDNSIAIINNYIKSDKVKLLRHEFNQGKGAAIKTAIPHLNGAYTIIQDADLEYDVNDIKKIIDYTVEQNNNNLVVYGSRNLNKDYKRNFSPYYWGVKLLTMVGNILYNQKITDQYTCYKLIPTHLLKKINLQSSGFEMEAEITAKVSKLNYKIHEVPISYQGRSKKDGKKIKFVDAFKGLKTLLIAYKKYS